MRIFLPDVFLILGFINRINKIAVIIKTRSKAISNNIEKRRREYLNCI